MFDSPSVSAPRLEAPALEFVPPHTLRHGARERRVGAVVYRLLRSLFHAPGHARAVAALEAEVWGHPVNRNTLWSACRRARSALVTMNHPLRVAMDGDRVTLV